MPRDCAQSSTPPTSAPDCDRKASFPGFGFAMPKLASTPSAGTQMPRQFGPMMRRQWGRAASSILCRSLRPSPAVRTTAARVPFFPSSAIRPGTVSGGVAKPSDAIKAILAGANVVQMVSAILRHGPAYMATMRRGLEEWLDRQHASSLDDMRGVVSLETKRDPGAFERAHYIRTLHSWPA